VPITRTPSSRALTRPPPSTETPSAPRRSSASRPPTGRLTSLELRLDGIMLDLADEFPERGVLAPPSIGGPQ
jgi:hypothetical protein